MDCSWPWRTNPNLSALRRACTAPSLDAWGAGTWPLTPPELHCTAWVHSVWIVQVTLWYGPCNLSKAGASRCWTWRDPSAHGGAGTWAAEGRKGVHRAAPRSARPQALFASRRGQRARLAEQRGAGLNAWRETPWQRLTPIPHRERGFHLQTSKQDCQRADYANVRIGTKVSRNLTWDTCASFGGR